MPGSGPGTGPGGLWASAMPLFMHEGPLTCTGPERGTLLGPSVHAGTGNLQAAGSLLGWRSPSALMASVAAGLAGWWWAWLARRRWGCPFLLCPRATLGDAPNKGRHRGNGVWLGMTGALVRRTGKLRWGAARLCVVGTRARWREMAGRAGAWPFMQNFLPPHLCRPRCSHGPGLGDPQRTPVCDSWGSLGPGLQPLPLGQPYRIPLPASWRTGPWSPCSASCGGGSQSRSVYCVSSDGAGSQEATGEAECAGQPGKPPATRACNLQRCAAWSAEPWGEVSLCPAGWGPNRAPGLWAGATAELGREAWPPLER